MFRLFLLFNLLLVNLLACKGGYASCKQKVIDSNTAYERTLEIPIEKHLRLVYSSKTPNCNAIKSDPYLGLYLVKDIKGFKYPFRMNMRYPSGLAAVNRTMVQEGKITKRQVGLNQFAHFSDAVMSPAVLLNSCCSLEGIVTPEGIIEKEYINRFLKIKEVSYADIGIRVEDQKKDIVVVANDPFMKNNPFKKGDCILSIDGKKARSSAQVMRDILFAKIGSAHKVKIKRGTKIQTISVISQKRQSGGYKSDTFLEQYGLDFDKNLVLIKIEEGHQDYGLVVGDKLLKVNGVQVTNQQEVLDNISSFKDNATLLFERRNFQFFVKVN